MFDTNQFKSQVKEWIRCHPDGSEMDLQDFCEELIPSAQYAAYSWMIDHTLSWYKHIVAQREAARNDYAMDPSVV